MTITDQSNGYAIKMFNAPNGRGLGYRVGGVRAWYVTDRQGSVVAVTDERGVKIGGYAYDPYGNTRASEEVDVHAVLNPRRYTGARYDLTTGLYLMGVRWYDPTQGRFTQPDPASRETNPYTYAAGNPINKTDPTGTMSSCADSAGGFFFSVGSLLLAPETGGISLPFSLAGIAWSYNSVYNNCRGSDDDDDYYSPSVGDYYDA